MTKHSDINQLSADQLHALVTELMDAKDQALGLKGRGLVCSNAIIEKLTHEMAAIEAELDQAMTEEQKAARPKQQSKPTPLPPELARLPTQKNNAIDELLSHNWKPAITATV